MRRLLLLASVFTLSGPLLRLYWLLRRKGGPDEPARGEA